MVSCDNTITLYQLEIKLKDTIPEDGTSNTQYYWNLEAQFLDGTLHQLSVEQVVSACPHGSYRNIAQGQYGLCTKCTCDNSHTILCDGKPQITPAQYEIGRADGTYCQPCHCAQTFFSFSPASLVRSDVYVIMWRRRCWQHKAAKNQRCHILKLLQLPTNPNAVDT